MVKHKLVVLTFGQFTCGAVVDEENYVTDTCPKLKYFRHKPFQLLKTHIEEINGKYTILPTVFEYPNNRRPNR